MKTIYAAIIYVVVAVLASGIAAFASPGWIMHPSFDNEPVRIIVTPERTYYLAHSRHFDKKYKDYAVPAANLFYHDGDINSGIKPLSGRFPLSGNAVCFADYDYAVSALIVVYDDLSADFIYDDGSVRHVDGLRDLHYPGSLKLNSVSFNPETGDVWLATDFGIAVIDAASLNVGKAAFGRAVQWVVPSGKGFMAVIDEKLYSAPHFSEGMRFGSLRPVSLDSAAPSGYSRRLSAVKALYPLSLSEFVMLSGVEGSDSEFALDLCALSRMKLHVTPLVTDQFGCFDEAHAVANRFECNLLPTASGVFLFAKGRLYEVKRNADSGGRMSVVDSYSSYEKLIYGSWNFRDFESHELRQGFHSAALSGDGWQIGKPVAPQCCAPMLCGKLFYTEQYGMLAVSRGNDHFFSDLYAKEPLLVSGYKDGGWTNYSPSANPPDYINTSLAVKNRFRRDYANSFPVSHPAGLLQDPLYPSHFYCGSVLQGLARVDFGNFTDAPLRIGSPNDPLASWPGFVAAAPRQSWYDHACFSNVEADAQGRLWTLYFNLDGPAANGATRQLWYWTPDDRKASLDAQKDVARFCEWRKVELPEGLLDATNNCFIKILKHKRHEGMMLIADNAYAPTFLLVGFGDNPERDGVNVRKIDRLLTEDGVKVHASYISCFHEDELTGDVWFGTQNELFRFNPDEIAAGSRIVRRLRLSDGSVFLHGLEIHDICGDSAGRLWFATSGGVAGLSASRSEVVARYRAADSGLPSDNTYAVGWNPVQSTLFISTDRGIAEVNPAIASQAEASALRIYPANVTPEYRGSVTIAGCKSDIVEIRDSRNQTVAKLTPDSEGVCRWNPQRSDGTPLPTGRYTVMLSDTAAGAINILR